MPTNKGPGVSAFGAAKAIRKRKAAARDPEALKKKKKRKPAERAQPKSTRKNRGSSGDMLSRAEAEAIRKRLAKKRKKLGDF